MGKPIVDDGAIEERLRQMLQHCARDNQRIVVSTSSQNPKQIIEPARLRFLGSIRAVAERWRCDPELVKVVTCNLGNLVEFTVPDDQLERGAVVTKPGKKHGKPKPPPAPRIRDVVIQVALRPGYDDILSEMLVIPLLMQGIVSPRAKAIAATADRLGGVAGG